MDDGRWTMDGGRTTDDGGWTTTHFKYFTYPELVVYFSSYIGSYVLFASSYFSLLIRLILQ